jgi:hypothetical protein
MDKIKERTGRSDTVNNISSASNFDSESDAKSNTSLVYGYSSNKSVDLEVKHYQKLRADFVVASPNLTNLCETTKAMIRREELK